MEEASEAAVSDGAYTVLLSICTCPITVEAHHKPILRPGDEAEHSHSCGSYCKGDAVGITFKIREVLVACANSLLALRRTSRACL
jgi:hypothetical protein